MKNMKVVITPFVAAVLAILLCVSCNQQKSSKQEAASGKEEAVLSSTVEKGVVPEGGFKGTPGSGGLVIEEKIDFIQHQSPAGAKTSPSQSRETITYLQGRKVRSESGNRVFILDFENNKAFNVNPTAKTYTELSMQQFRAAQKMALKWIEGLRKQMEEKLADLPPEKRQAMEEKLAALPQGPSAKQDKQVKTEVKATGKKEKINGFPCQEYEIYEDGEKTAVYWLTDKVDIGPYDTYQTELKKGLGGMGPLAGNQVEEWELIRDKGFPIRVNRIKPILGKISFNREVLSVEGKSLSDDVFLPPEDYKSLENPPMPTPAGPRGKMPTLPPAGEKQGNPQ